MRAANAKKKIKTGPSSSTAIGGSSNSNETIVVKPPDENELTIQLEKVKNGTHEELLRRKLVVEKESDRKIAASDRHRKLQIKNIHDLYDYEVSNLQSARERTIRMVEEKFLTELQSQLDSIKARTKHLRPVAEHSSTNEPPVERSLRSVAANSSTVKESLDWNNLIKEKDKVVPARRQKVPNPNTTTMLEPKLDEKDVRSDFLHIVKDLEQRAGNYSKRVPPPTTTAPTATTNGKSTTTAGQTLLPSVKVDAVGRLVVNDKTFTVGDAIEVYSLLSDESFVGSITVIDSEEVILRSEAGPRFSFPISVIKSGRVVIKGDVVLKEDPELTIISPRLKRMIAAGANTSSSSSSD